jgi:hypothetical protein
MKDRRDRVIYSLFFATKAIKGFLKMKEAMWSVDKASGRQYSDAVSIDVTQFELFGLQSLRDDLLRKFQGMRVLMSRITAFVEAETRYLRKHAIEVLGDLERRGDISVRALNGRKRRRGTFPDHLEIEFKSERSRWQED